MVPARDPGTWHLGTGHCPGTVPGLPLGGGALREGTTTCQGLHTHRALSLLEFCTFCGPIDAYSTFWCQCLGSPTVPQGQNTMLNRKVARTKD